MMLSKNISNWDFVAGKSSVKSPRAILRTKSDA